MKLAAKLMVAVIANAVALIAAAYAVHGFNLVLDVKSIALLAAILTALNVFLKPLLKVFMGPIIILTFGVGLIFVNMIILYILDILSQDLTIEGISALVYSSIIVGLVNFVFHLATKD